MADVRDCRVAICDDSTALVRLLELTLSVEDGLEVVGTAGDGLEVVDLCARTTPDVLLLDVAMPLRDGIEALPHVREASPDTTVLVYTGFASEEVRQRAIDAGAWGLLLKGGSPVELAAKIRQAYLGASESDSAPTQG